MRKLWKREKRGRQNNDKKATEVGSSSGQWMLHCPRLRLLACALMVKLSLIFLFVPLFLLCTQPSASSQCFWSSQLHAWCVRDTIQKLQRKFFPTNQSLSVVGKASPSMRESSYRKPIGILVTFFTTIMQPRHSSRGRCVGSKKHQPRQIC